jgi:hypothetical protein
VIGNRITVVKQPKAALLQAKTEFDILPGSRLEVLVKSAVFAHEVHFQAEVARVKEAIIRILLVSELTKVE